MDAQYLNPGAPLAESETKPSISTAERACTGVAGLDDILGGGLPRDHFYLLDGSPGTGKTTIALQFLLDGARNGEKGLYVTLSESKNELKQIAKSHGWSLDLVDIFELTPDDAAETYTLFHPAEIELQRTIDRVFEMIRELQPRRVIFDSLSEMRLLARDPLRFRRQIMALKQFFNERPATVIMLDDKTAPDGDLQLHSLAHGVIALEHISLDYGEERRRLQVTKLRGVRYRGGYHDFRIKTGGIAVFPRIRTHAQRPASREVVKSGSPAMDDLLGGGLARGTSALITGAAGTGKSALATQYAMAAVDRGEAVKFYLFDERLSTFHQRAEGLGITIREGIEALDLQQIEPTEMSPGEFAHEIVNAVAQNDVSMIVIDSINGYLQSMPEERLLPIQVHELLSYLSNKNVTVLMTLVQRGVFGDPVDEAADVSFLADTVILLRYFEYDGEVRQAVSVVKKRTGNHEHTIREARVDQGGLYIGEPLRKFHGVLTGVPHYTGESQRLMDKP